MKQHVSYFLGWNSITGAIYRVLLHAEPLFIVLAEYLIMLKRFYLLIAIGTRNDNDNSGNSIMVST